MTIRGMAKSDNKEKHYFQSLEAGSGSFVQVIRGDKGRIETSLVPHWKSNREVLTTFIKTINTNSHSTLIYIVLTKR